MPGAVNLGAALINYQARDANFTRVSNSVSQQVKKLAAEFKQFRQGTERANQATANFRRSLSRLGVLSAGGVGISLLTRQAKEYADTWILTNNRLRLVTTSQANLTNTQKDVLQLAQDTRSEYAATVELYSRISRSSKEFGVAQSEVLGIARTVNQAIRIGGATAQEARAGVIQFGQALASGQLRGEELRSVMEQLIRLSQALAAGLGVGIGDLRRLAESGQLTTNRIIDALQSQAPLIQEEFEQLTPTISETFTVLNNRVLAFIGTINEATGASSAFNAILRETADVIESLTPSTGSAIASADDLSKRILEIQNQIAQNNEKIGNRPGRLLQILPTLENRELQGTLDFLRSIQQQISNLEAASAALDATNQRIEKLRATIDRLGRANRSAPSDQNIRQIRDLYAQLELENQRQQILSDIQQELSSATTPDAQDSRTPEQIKQLERLIARYQRLGEQLGKTKEEYDLYLATELGASDAQLASIRSVQRRIAAEKELEAQRKRSAAALRQQHAAELDFLVLQEESRDRAEDFSSRADSNETLSDAVSGLIVAPENSALEQMLENYRDMAVTLGFTERQMAAYRATLAGANVNQLEIIDAAINSRQAFEAYTEGLAEHRREIQQNDADIRQFAQTLAANYTSALEEAIVRGRSFSEVMNSLAQDIARLVLRITILKPLAESLAATFSNARQSTGGLSGFLRILTGGLSLFGGGGGAASAAASVQLPTPEPGFSGVFPGLAGGGPAYAGRSYLVGERGPELFQPGVSGRVISNADLSRFRGSGGPAVVINENITIESTDGPGVERAFARYRPIMEQRTEQIVRQVTRVDSSRPSGLSRR